MYFPPGVSKGKPDRSDQSINLLPLDQDKPVIMVLRASQLVSSRCWYEQEVVDPVVQQPGVVVHPR
jgi:hypothetical protein